MNDFERIKKIESELGISFRQVKFGSKDDWFGGNRYYLDEAENITTIAFDSSPVHLIKFDSLFGFQYLTQLFFNDVNLSDCSFLKELKGLIRLIIISKDQVDILVLEELKELESLILISDNLINLTSLKELIGLKSLFLKSNKLNDISILKELKGLTSLVLVFNNLVNITFLKDLVNLITLDLSINQINDGSALSELVNLKSLNLSSNKLTDASFLKNLISLNSLNLNNNQLTDASFLKNLKNIQTLDLQGNKIETLPENFFDTNMEICFKSEPARSGFINLNNNPLKSPPIYIAQRGKIAIKKYFQEGEPYLDYIQIKNYFSLESISVVNLADKKEIYFLGENGDGKTILLQAIALALKGDQKFGIISDVLRDNSTFRIEQNEDSIEQLPNLFEVEEKDFNIRNDVIEFYKHSISDNKTKPEKKEKIVAEPLFEATDSFGYKKQYKEGNTEFPHINVYAYGINRVFNKNDETREDENKEVYLSLFDHRYGLTDPVQWLKDIRLLTLENKEKGLPEPIVTVSLAQQLLSELLSKEIEIKISGTSVTFSEKGSAPVSFRQLSDGYKSVINWLCDLLSRLSQNQPHVSKLEDYYGIVLVDEIGVYLHPRLQFSLIRMLRDKFKKIQWIFTTHSPIITLGASEDAVFYKLYKENGKTQIAGPVNGIAGMTANSLITSILWRLDEFTTQGTDINQINSDDYIYKVIHDAIRERIKKNINLSDKDTAQMVQKLLDNLKTLESKITQDWESDVSTANQLLDA